MAERGGIRRACPQRIGETILDAEIRVEEFEDLEAGTDVQAAIYNERIIVEIYC